MADGIFTGSATIGVRFHHLGSGYGIGPQGPDFGSFAVGVFDLFDDGGSDPTPLAVYYHYSNQERFLPLID